MFGNNKGSILIVTLIIFSIVNTICMMSISLIGSSIKTSNLELKSLVLKEKALSSIEFVSLNMKDEVDNIIDKTNNWSEFVDYVRNDNFKNFINKSKDISYYSLDNIQIELINKTPFGSVNNLEFAMKVIAIDDVYKKQISVNITIKNPWDGITIDNYIVKDEEKLIIEELEELNTDLDEVDSNIINNEDKELDENLQIKDDLKNQKLINIYNYEEL